MEIGSNLKNIFTIFFDLFDLRDRVIIQFDT